MLLHSTKTAESIRSEDATGATSEVAPALPAIPTCPLAYYPLVDQGLYRTVEGLQAEVYVGLGVDAGEDAAGAGHQVNAPHL